MAPNSYLTDPNIQYPNEKNLAFGDYIKQCQTLIRQYRLDLNSDDAEKIITTNSPYELTPTRENKDVGALVIHGLYDCPFVMKDIAIQLQQQGLLTRSILLPGHGTVPGSLLHTSYNDWIQTTEYGIASLSKEVKKIILVGYSTGGTLALYHLLKNSYENIAGIILIAPAIQIYSRLAFASSWPNYISWAWQRANWLHVGIENDYAKYQSFTFNSAFQIYQLTKLVKSLSLTKKISTPMFYVISQDDKTVASTGTLSYFHQYASPQSQLLLYTNRPTQVLDPRITVRPASYAQMKIINMSHVALPIAPDNYHYGKNGDYLFASRVDENNLNTRYLYGTYNNFQNRLLNLLYVGGFYKYERIRLTFNPDFDFLKQKIGEFVQNCIHYGNISQN